MFPRWMIRVVRLVVGRDSANVTFVNSSVDLWDNFVESSAVKELILSSKTHRKTFPVAKWLEQLVIAFRLCRDMDLEDRLDMKKVYPVLCRLITGSYFAEKGVAIPYDQEKFLLHAVIGNTLSRSCPKSIFHWIIREYPEQLRTVEPIHGQLPLAAACGSKRCGPDRMMTILLAYPHAASVSDSQGRYPLHLACQNGCFAWQTGIQQLFQAAPVVLLIPTVDGHSVFVWTVLAQAERTSTLRKMRIGQCAHETNTVFEILRCDPTVVRGFIDE